MRVVITGASSGIGEALARHYAGEGAVLGLISRRAPAAGLPGKVIHYPADVTDVSALGRVAADFGTPDLVIANAGVGVGTHGEDIADVEKLRRVLDVNVAGLAATLAAFAPGMRKAGRGTLAGIASVAGFRGLAGNGAYCATLASRRRTAVTHASGESGRSGTPPVRRSSAVWSARSWAGSVRRAGSMEGTIIRRNRP